MDWFLLPFIVGGWWGIALGVVMLAWTVLTVRDIVSGRIQPRGELDDQFPPKLPKS